MNINFQRLMQDAARLTRSGNLQAATDAIRHALGGRQQDPADEVIDVESRFVPDPVAGVLADGHPAADAPAPQTEARAPAFDREPAGFDCEGTEEAFIAGKFGTGVAARDYKLYVPPTDGSQLLPLVVMLHGCTQDPDDFAAGTGMNAAAREQGFYVLYPAQSTKANPHRCWNWFKHSHQERGRGEAAILADMTARVIAQHGIDPDRVYVAGLSAGGAMAAILAQAYPDVFAAVGVHSGLPPGAAGDLPAALQAMKGDRKPRRAVALDAPTIVFHGDADPTVHPVNGASLFDAVGSGTGNVQVEEGQAPGGRTWTRRTKVDADGKSVAEYWQVHGGAHAWFGGSASGSYTDPRGPDATAAMLRFFWGHRRTSARA